MAETSEDRKERLQREGRWGAFCKRRDELKKQGLAPKAADKQASVEFAAGSVPAQPDGSGAQSDANAAGTGDLGAATAERVPESVPAVDAVGSGGGGIVPAPDAEELSVDIRRDHLWVYANLRNSAVRESDAPGPGAWAMLRQCQADAEECSKFYARIGKLLPSRAQIDAEARFSDDGRNVLRTIEKVRRAFKSALLRAGAERTAGESEL